MATFEEVNVTATRIVRDIAGVDHTEGDERKRQKLFRYGTSGSRSQTVKDKQTWKRVEKHIRQWDGGGYREKCSSTGWTRFEKFCSCQP